MAGFTTLAKVKEELRIPAADTTHDARLTTIVAGVNAYFFGLFQLTDTDPTSYTETYDVLDFGTEGFWLVQYPVVLATGVTEVKFDGTVQDADTYYLGRPRPMGLLCFKTSAGAPFSLPCGRQHIEVTHTAGWAAGDEHLVALCGAATILAAYRFNTGGSKLGLDSEKIGQYSYKLAAGVAGAGVGAGGSGRGYLPPDVSLILGGLIRPFAPGS